MLRSSLTLLSILALLLVVVPAYATTTPEWEVEDFTAPCAMQVTQAGPVRTLSWVAVPGGATYRVGYRIGSVVTVLAQLPGTSYDHVGWDPNACFEYLVAAYDGGGWICSAHVLNVGGGCMQ